MRISYWSSDVCSSDLFPCRKHSATMWVDFVWVRARWSRYRQALVKRARDAGEDTLCAYLHADHIVARRRLEHLPDAWVMLLEVPKHANSTFGSRIEKKLQIGRAHV